jgi:hypothetical protein
MFFEIKFTFQNMAMRTDVSREEFRDERDAAHDFLREYAQEHRIQNRTFSGRLLLPKVQTGAVAIVIDESYDSFIPERNHTITNLDDPYGSAAPG